MLGPSGSGSCRPLSRPPQTLSLFPASVTHVQRVDGLGNIELIHSGQDDGGCGQEKEHHEEGEVDAEPP